MVVYLTTGKLTQQEQVKNVKKVVVRLSAAFIL